MAALQTQPSPARAAANVRAGTQLSAGIRTFSTEEVGDYEAVLAAARRFDEAGSSASWSQTTSCSASR
jgi:hypothetical protein